MIQKQPFVHRGISSINATEVINSSNTTVSPPCRFVIVYNQSPHAVKSVVDELRSEWGKRIKIIQVVQDRQKLPNVDDKIMIQSGQWNNLAHFQERLLQYAKQNADFRLAMNQKKAAFTAVWSGFAESGDTGRKVMGMGLVWTGTDPDISDGLEKMGFKQYCNDVGAPTPAWFQLPIDGNIDAAVANIQSSCDPGGWMIKSIYGGGGVGTKSINDPNNTDEVRSALDKVISETKAVDGIYLEKKIEASDGFYQVEIEVDGHHVSHGTRIVWFNADHAKVLEIGCQDQYVKQFGIPRELIAMVKNDVKNIALASKNNTRATAEALIFKNKHGDWQHSFIEMNRRPQVENEALAYLECHPTTGERRKTFVESFKRAYGIPYTPLVPSNVAWVAHGRILVGDPNEYGRIINHLGTIEGFSGELPAGVVAESICHGEISSTSNPQHGRVIVVGESLHDVCHKLQRYFQQRKPVVLGSSSTYGEAMARILRSSEFKKGNVASNKTFADTTLQQCETPHRIIEDVLHSVACVLTNGYRPGEGVDSDRFPTETQLINFSNMIEPFEFLSPPDTSFSQLSRGEISYDQYIDQIKGQLETLGGGWNNVAPRDTRQQAGDSESASLVHWAKRITEQYYAPAGAIDHEGGGAQYQAGLIRGFNPWAILELGLSSNIMSSALIRSQWLNGLAELPDPIRDIYFHAIAHGVRHHYGLSAEHRVPFTFNNFHAGNFFNSNGSTQDATTEQMLRAGLIPRPNWVFSSRFTLDQLREWVNRQLNLFERNGHRLREIRIKNPGQGLDYTAVAIWQHIQVIRDVFKDRGIESPIICLHNHDFNGNASHELYRVLKKAQSEKYPYIVVDAAYRKSGTHADNTIIGSALSLSTEQYDLIQEGNRHMQLLESLTTRFDSRDSQMTPWDSDWAGGTEGSDIRIAKEYGLSLIDIEKAKQIASQVFPLERAVTPFSEYKLRLGIAIMIAPEINPKTMDCVVEFIQNGGKLNVGGDVLLGIDKWETLVDKPPIINQLLLNMKNELTSAKQMAAQPLQPKPTDALLNQFIIAGFQKKGMDWLDNKIKDVTPLILSPHVLHAKPGELPVNTPFKVRLSNGRVEDVVYLGRSLSDDGTAFTLSFKVNESVKQVTIANPSAVLVNSTGPTLAKDNEYGLVVPGELINLLVSEGDQLTAGAPMATVESMKMQIDIDVPQWLDGARVNRICSGIKTRTATTQGSILPKNGAVFGYTPKRQYSMAAWSKNTKKSQGGRMGLVKNIPIRTRVVAGVVAIGHAWINSRHGVGFNIQNK